MALVAPALKSSAIRFHADTICMGAGIKSSSGLANIFTVDSRAHVVLGEAPKSSLDGASFVPLLNSVEYPYREGRGVYIPVESCPGRFYYVKGAGNEEALASRHGSNTERFPAIGHADTKEYQLAPLSAALRDMQTGPRVRGALSLPHAIREYAMCDAFRVAWLTKHTQDILQGGVPSCEIFADSTARKFGLSIPVAVVDSPGISEEINEVLSAIGPRGASKKGEDPLEFKYGMVVLEVPSSERIRPHIRPAALTRAEHHRDVLTSFEKTQMVGRVVKNQLECGVVTQSVHFQNVYNAPHSVCPQADHADLVFIGDIIDRGEELGVGYTETLTAVVMNQLRFAPFLTLVKPDLQGAAIQGIHSILSVVIPGRWDELDCMQLCAEFLRHPHSVLSMIAEELITRGTVEVRRPEMWARVMEECQEFGFQAINDMATENVLRAALSFSEGLKRREKEGGLR